MVTLLFVTFPIEIVFLTVLRLLGWLHLPAVFMVLSVFFFCIAVSVPFCLCVFIADEP